MKEKWSEIYTLDQIKKIQEIELTNLKVMDNVCKALNIVYFLYGGTLIGAVRHKGFVPWDDDLDVAMPREEYKRFVSEASKLLPKEYYLQNPYSDKKTPYLYSKLRLKGTKFVEFSHHKLRIEQGIYIDIYPIDNIPDDDTDYIRQHLAFQKLAKIYVLRQCPYPTVIGKSFKRRIKNLGRFVLSSLMKIIPQKYFVNRMESIMTKYNNKPTKRVGNLFYPKPSNVFHDLFPLQDGIFEDMPVKLPGNWDMHLTARYGKYMVLPAEDERIGHIPFLLDFGFWEPASGRQGASSVKGVWSVRGRFFDD